MNAWPTATAALLSAVEAAIEGALKYDPGSRAALARLGEHTLALHVSAPTANIYLHLTESGVRFSQHHEGDIATSLSGRAGDLARLVFAPVSNLHGTGVTVAGNTALLAGLQAIVQNLEIDWEDALAEHLGILPAHGLASFISGSANWQRERLREAGRLSREYLTEELGAALGRAEFDVFSEDVHQLTLALDRAQANLTHLRAALAARAASTRNH